MTTLSHVAETAVPEAHVAGGGKNRGRKGVRHALGIILRIVLCLVFGLPLLFMIISSFKSDQQIFADLGGLRSFLPVGDLSLDNYLGVFDRVPFVQFMVNSVMISVVTVVCGTSVCVAPFRQRSVSSFSSPRSRCSAARSGPLPGTS